MKILVTNDDGIYSSGIYALWDIAKEFGDVTVVAPNTEKSAVGHGITTVSYTHLRAHETDQLSRMPSSA